MHVRNHIEQAKKELNSYAYAAPELSRSFWINAMYHLEAAKQLALKEKWDDEG